MYISTEDTEEEDTEEQEGHLQEMEYLAALEESLMIRAMTGGSSQKLTTLDWRILFILR